MGLEDYQAEHPGVPGVQQGGQCGEVVQGLGHLLAIHLDHPVVDPVLGKGPAASQGLGPLVLVVGEDQVVTPAVDVEAVAQQVERHGHALDVPAGSSRSPRRVPRGLAGLGCLPEGEVEWVILVIVHFDPGSGAVA